MYVVLNQFGPAASWQMEATIFISTPCARTKITARPGAVPASSSPARKAWKRSGLAWKRICFRVYFLPWFGVRSGRALISHTCSSAAKPRPKRMSVGSWASAAHETSTQAKANTFFIGCRSSSGEVRIEFFPVYQPVSQRQQRAVERKAERRDDDHQREDAIGLERRQRVADEVAEPVDRADHLGDHDHDQRHGERDPQRREHVRHGRGQHDAPQR